MGAATWDFVGGIGVLNVGHNHPRVIAAVKAQLGRISHASFQVAGYEPYIALARPLNALVGGGDAYKSIFLTSGAEAVENAVKIARAYTNRPGVIAFRGGFHGRTLLGVTLTGFAQPYKQNFGPFPADIYHTPFPNPYRGITTERALAELDELFATTIAPERVAAILIEPVQGDGGFLAAPALFLQRLREITARHGIVLIADEIQTGFGRTGTMFAFEQAGIRLDLVTVAKSLAGGLGGTYGGNALACAAALAVLDAFEQDGLLERSAVLAGRLRTALGTLKRRHPAIGDARGLGFMQAIEIVGAAAAPDAATAQRIIDAARDRGLLVIKCGMHRNVIRFLAPLVTTDAQMDEALAILGEALAAANA
jgi:4-aminobutyrate aminotransferase / (S)-3-amino-2-methylpropionate transaminase / 5-aminovalerate transaminase